MAYVFVEGGYGAAATVIHSDPPHPDVISVPDAELLRSGTFHRLRADLHLKVHDCKITGDVTVERNGARVALHAGDAVYKSNVIQTGGGSAVAISSADGTAVHLAANTRMVLTSYSFDPTSDSNDAPPLP